MDESSATEESSTIDESSAKDTSSVSKGNHQRFFIDYFYRFSEEFPSEAFEEVDVPRRRFSGVSWVLKTLSYSQWARTHWESRVTLGVCFESPVLVFGGCVLIGKLWSNPGFCT